MDRYARQICLPEVGTDGQARLAAARVLVVGAGGLGAALLPLLAGAGVGHLRIVDPDVVEQSNLHRQTLYRMSDLGRPKAAVAAETLADLNPDCRIEALVARLDPALAREQLVWLRGGTGSGVVVDAADVFAVTYALSDLCEAATVPLISSSVLGFAGYVGGFCGGAPGYRALFPDLPAVAQSCASAGVIGPAVATLGALQAQMVLSVLLALDPSPLGQLLRLDLKSWRISGFRFDAAEAPQTPGPRILAAQEVTEGDLVIELRDAVEAPALPFPQARRLSPEAVALFVPDPGRRTVFVCATGLRAWRAACTVISAHGAEAAVLALPQ